MDMLVDGYLEVDGAVGAHAVAKLIFTENAASNTLDVNVVFESTSSLKYAENVLIMFASAAILRLSCPSFRG